MDFIKLFLVALLVTQIKAGPLINTELLKNETVGVELTQNGPLLEKSETREVAKEIYDFIVAEMGFILSSVSKEDFLTEFLISHNEL